MSVPSPRAHRLYSLGLPIAIGLFLAMGWWVTDVTPLWSEEVAVVPGAGQRVLDLEHGVAWDGTLPFARSCAEPNAPWLVQSLARPRLSLCLGGQALPVMSTAYSASFMYWSFALAEPLGADMFAVRKAALLFGVLALLLTWRLALQLADRKTAALAVLLQATNTTFVLVSGTTFFYETMPLFFFSAALLLWVGCPELHPRTAEASGDRRAPATWRLVVGAVFTGLALLANVKTLVLLAPIAVLAWRSGVRVQVIERRQLQWMAGAVGLVLSPALIFSLFDPNHGFQEQVSARLMYLMNNLRIERVWEEVLSLLVYATDMFAYLMMASLGDAELSYVILAAAGIPIARCLWQTITALRRKSGGTPFGAGVGALILGYFPIGVLFYSQFPASSYVPLHSAFGPAMAVGVIGLEAWLDRGLARRGAQAATRIPWALIATLVLMGMNVWNFGRRGEPTAYLKLPFNSHAERATAAYLRSVPDPGLLITTTYNFAGVFDRLRIGQVKPVQGFEYFAGCEPQGGEVADDVVKECVVERWRKVLSNRQALPLRVISPVKVSGVDQPRRVLPLMDEALRRASWELHLTTAVEQQFSSAAGEPLISLFRITASAPEPQSDLKSP